MTRDDKAAQIKVGAFILVGLVIVATMVVYFGRLGEGAAGSYYIRAEFPNASGLIRGSEVLLAGARVGRVDSNPTILPNLDGVFVELRIFGGVKIPTASAFSIGSSGLLGDKFVQIGLLPGAKESPPIAPGATVKGGTEGGGLGGMAEGASGLITELRTAVGNINSVAKKLDTGVLNDEGIRSIADTIRNLKSTSEHLSVTAGAMDKVVANAGTAVEQGKTTMQSVQSASEQLTRVLEDVRGLVRDVRQGRGTVGALLTDRAMADNLKTLVANMRRYGILFYKDKATEPGR